MHFLPSLLLHFLASLPITTTAASPIDPFAPQAEEGLQRILREADNPHQRPGPPQKSNHHFDAAPNSVGLLLTTASGTKGAQEVVHVWLPLGRRVEIRDAPTLPSHPKSARITTLIHSLPELATPERLGEVECEVFLRVNETRVEEGNWEAGWGERRMGRKPRKDVLRSVTFGRRDGLVRLADPGGGFWIGGGGGEVEAYECR